MFHRQRPDFHVHPALMQQQRAVPPAETAEPPMTADDAPVDVDVALPVSSSPSQPQPLSQEKETEPMSNYNTQAQNSADTQNDAAQNAAPAAYAQQQAPMNMRPAMPNMAQRSPYGYNQSTYMPTAETAVSTGRKLVIGEGITMSGEIEACDHLVVEGTVEASLKGASVLDVSQSGMFFGAVEINEATIAGRFEGDLVVNGRLTVRATGTITGTISYKELAVEAGATIDGKINPMSGSRLTTATDRKVSTQATGTSNKGLNVKPASGMTPESANELPFAGNKAAAA